MLLWCLGVLISPRKDTEYTEKRRVDGRAVCGRRPWEGAGSCRAGQPWEGEAPAEPRVETDGCDCGVWVGLFHHGKTRNTRKNDVLTVALFAGAGLGSARLVA